MIEPENMPFDDKEREDAVNNLRNNQNTEGDADLPDINPSDIDRLDQATRASEASFTLDPEKGVPPAPGNDTAKDDQ